MWHKCICKKPLTHLSMTHSYNECQRCNGKVPPEKSFLKRLSEWNDKIEKIRQKTI